MTNMAKNKILGEALVTKLDQLPIFLGWKEVQPAVVSLCNYILQYAFTVFGALFR